MHAGLVAGLEGTSGGQEARAGGPRGRPGQVVLAQDCRASQEGTPALVVTGGRLCPASEARG